MVLLINFQKTLSVPLYIFGTDMVISNQYLDQIYNHILWETSLQLIVNFSYLMVTEEK